MNFGTYLLILAVIMSEDISAQKFNLDNWMTELPEQLKNVPLIYLAIPGSHDSMTYGITRASGLAPDAEPILNRLYPLFRGTILRWTITQVLDAHQQLLVGIRYLDLRLATKTGELKFYFTHGLYAGEITEPLMQVKEFLDNHPGEVVILDFQHFYGFTLEDHQRLIKFLLNLYGPKLIPKQLDLQSITLNSLQRLRQQLIPKEYRHLNINALKDYFGISDAGSIHNYSRFQVIVVYRNQAVYSTNELWQPQMMPSPWPQQDSIIGLLSFLQNIKRHPGMGFIHQAVLTPTPGFILFRWMSNLREKCAVPVNKEVLPKLQEFTPGPPRAAPARAPLNVVIADFVDIDDALFSKTIIQLNYKLLRNTDIVYHNG